MFDIDELRLIRSAILRDYQRMVDRLYEIKTKSNSPFDNMKNRLDEYEILQLKIKMIIEELASDMQSCTH